MSGGKVYNIFISSANKEINETNYDFSIFFDNDEINVNLNEGVNVNVVSFSMLNSMYNVNQHKKNNTFQLFKDGEFYSTITIPYGNYNVYTFMEQLNTSFAGLITVAYNVATNTYTFTKTAVDAYSIVPMSCSKLLGLTSMTPILSTGTTSGYVNMVDYQQIILRCPTLVYESCSMDNIQDKDNFIAVSDFLYWVNKQDVEPFRMISYKNEDCSTVYSYNVINKSFSTLNFKLVNEYYEPIYDAPEFLLQLQITIFKKDADYFKEAALQALKLLNDIYFILLNIVSFFGFFQRKLKK
jgi:hypothetical protein